MNVSLTLSEVWMEGMGGGGESCVAGGGGGQGIGVRVRAWVKE